MATFQGSSQKDGVPERAEVSGSEVESNIDIEEDSKGKTVLITGGAGFIGSHVADFLLSRGDKVVICDEMNDYYDVRLKNSNLEHLYLNHGEKCIVYQGDICDEAFMEQIWETERITHVCHLAARAGVRPSIIDPYIYVHSNIEGNLAK